jgi:hypothetical protein
MNLETHSPTPSKKPNGEARADVPTTVDELLALDADRLARLYAGASVPELGRIQGDLKGRMLAWPGVHGRAAGWLRAFASSDRFPWRGKSFQPHSATDGEGKNRILSERVKLFRFTTFVARSRAGAFDAVQLDYDHPENPFFIRAIKDEIRELRPGLYLGQAWLRTGSKERLVLYFGLQSS